MGNNRTFTAAMQFGNERAGWLTLDPPTAVEAYHGSDDARTVALDYAADRDQPGEGWRVLVWQGDSPDYTTRSPDAEIYPTDMREHQAARRAIRTRGRGGAGRWRVRGPVSPVVRKVQAGRLEPGTKIFVTTDRRNTSAYRCPGPLYPANTSSDTEIALVKQVTRLVGRGETVVTVVTTVGEIPNLSEGQPVIPAP